MQKNPKLKSPDKLTKISHRIKLHEAIRGIGVEEHKYEPLDLSIFPHIDIIKEEKKEKKAKYSPKQTEFTLEKVYLQRPSLDSSKLLVYLYVDYGFLKPNRLRYFVERKEDHYEMLADVKIIILNENLEIITQIPMLHSSNFKGHPVAEIPELFVGFIEGLNNESRYYYTIECYRKNDNKVFAKTKINPINIATQDEKRPQFILAISDLHGGHSAWFKRGKAWCLFPHKNRKLNKITNKIVENEDLLTFGEGYKLICASGDLVDNGSYHEYWADLFECTAPLVSRTPFISAIGNHDYYSGGFWRGSWLGGKNRTCKYFHAFLQTPREAGLEGHYFYLDVGNARLFFIDSVGTNWGNIDFSCQSDEWSWLKNELEKWRKQLHNENGKKFSMIFLHSAIFSAGFFGRVEHNSDYNAQCALTPLMRKYGVNIALFGHDHIYQRSIWFDTNYICLGLSAGVAIGYNKHRLKKVKYTVSAIGKGKKVRGYLVIYIPPNLTKMSEKEKEEFKNWTSSIEEKLMKTPIQLFYKISQAEAKELEMNYDKKRTFIRDNIISKLSSHMWLRYYTIKNELYDQVFLAPNIENYDETGKIDYILNCPEEHV